MDAIVCELDECLMCELIGAEGKGLPVSDGGKPLEMHGTVPAACGARLQA
jgi:hypothetical protein